MPYVALREADFQGFLLSSQSNEHVLDFCCNSDVVSQGLNFSLFLRGHFLENFLYKLAGGIPRGAMPSIINHDEMSYGGILQMI